MIFCPSFHFNPVSEKKGYPRTCIKLKTYQIKLKYVGSPKQLLQHTPQNIVPGSEKTLLYCRTDMKPKSCIKLLCLALYWSMELIAFPISLKKKTVFMTLLKHLSQTICSKYVLRLLKLQQGNCLFWKRKILRDRNPHLHTNRLVCTSSKS